MSKQSKNSAATQSGLQLLPEEKIFVGCDVHAGKYAVAFWAAQRGEWVCEWVQNDDDQALIKRLDPLRTHVVRVVYEAGPTGFSLARALRAAGFPVEVIAASHTARPAVAPDKSDRRDARELARLASQPGLLHPVYIPSEQEEQDRQVWRIREQHKTLLARTKQRLKALLLCHGLAAPAGLKHWSKAGVEALRAMALPEALRWSVDELLLTLEEARKAVMRANRKLRQLAKSERYKERVERLRTVPGVGPIVSMGFLLELLNLERFEDRRALSRFLALCPKVGRSNEQSWSEGRPELGQAVLRSLLVEAAWRWRRGDPYARMLFERYLANTAMKQKAIVALAHKLAVILWHLAKGKLPYLPGLQNVPRAVAGLAPKKSPPARKAEAQRAAPPREQTAPAKPPRARGKGAEGKAAAEVAASV